MEQMIKEMEETIKVYSERGKRLEKLKSKADQHHGAMYLALAAELKTWVTRFKTN